jgi:hypothetical protein
MVRWEYCELRLTLTESTTFIYSPRGYEERKSPHKDWPKTMLDLGNEGWELVSVVVSASGAHEYWYYFKRPLAS